MSNNPALLSYVKYVCSRHKLIICRNHTERRSKQEGSMGARISQLFPLEASVRIYLPTAIISIIPCFNVAIILGLFNLPCPLT